MLWADVKGVSGFAALWGFATYSPDPAYGYQYVCYRKHCIERLENKHCIDFFYHLLKEISYPLKLASDYCYMYF